MTAPITAPSLLDATGVDPDRARRILGEALAGADDGELFLERSESEMFVFDDGRLKTASYDAGEGFGAQRVRQTARPGECSGGVSGIFHRGLQMLCGRHQRRPSLGAPLPMRGGRKSRQSEQLGASLTASRPQGNRARAK